MKRLAVCVSVSAVFLAFAQLAEARGAICEHVQEDMFTIDGMKDDWQGGRATVFGRGDDARLELFCAHDRDTLYLLFDVRDDKIVRSRGGKARGQDQISLRLGAGRGNFLRLSILPGSERVPRKNASVPSFVKVEDSLQDHGFSVEMAIPLAKVPRWSGSVPYLSASLLFHDVDKASAGKPEKVVGVRGKLHFSDAVQSYQAFMKSAGLRNRDIRLDKLVNMDPGAGPERVLVGGKVVGLLGRGFSYMSLPIARAEDLLSARVVDFDNSGRYGLVTELRQHGNGGSRDVVIVWFAKGDGSFQPALTVETRKELSGMTLKNDWELVPRGQHRPTEGKRRRKRRAQPGKDILVRVGEVQGFTRENYREMRAPDARPILVPWGEQQSAVYYFDGTVGYGGEPALP